MRKTINVCEEQTLSCFYLVKASLHLSHSLLILFLLGGGGGGQIDSPPVVLFT